MLIRSCVVLLFHFNWLCLSKQWTNWCWL